MLLPYTKSLRTIILHGNDLYNFSNLSMVREVSHVTEFYVIILHFKSSFIRVTLTNKLVKRTHKATGILSNSLPFSNASKQSFPFFLLIYSILIPRQPNKENKIIFYKMKAHIIFFPFSIFNIV